jgi:hypothetical protein
MKRFSFPLLTAAVVAGFCIATSAFAQLTDARFTEVEGSVAFQKPGQRPSPARLNLAIQPADIVRTGQRSLAELEFNDKTLTRLGANTIFSYNPENRRFQVDQGTALLQVPPKLGGAKIESGAVTAAITGTTVLVQRLPNGTSRYLVLEGRMNVTIRGSNQMRSLGPGQMLIIPPDIKSLPQPVTVNVATILGTSRLVRGRRPLPSEGAIEKVVAKQEQLLSNEGFSPAGVVITNLDDLRGLTGARTLDSSTFDALTLEVFGFEGSSSGETSLGNLTIPAGSILTLTSNFAPGFLDIFGVNFPVGEVVATGPNDTIFFADNLIFTGFPTITNPNPVDGALFLDAASISFQNLLNPPDIGSQLNLVYFFSEGDFNITNSVFKANDFFLAADGNLNTGLGTVITVDKAGAELFIISENLNINSTQINLIADNDFFATANNSGMVMNSSVLSGIGASSDITFTTSTGPLSIVGSTIGGPGAQSVTLYAFGGGNLSISNSTISANTILLGGNAVILDAATNLFGSIITINTNSFQPNGATLSTTPIINPYTP